MTWFVSTDTYRRKITDPVSGEEAEVELRPLNAGDRARLDDSIEIDDEGSGNIRLGKLRHLTVQTALVSWTLPLSVTPETIGKLSPEVFDQIFNLVSLGEAPEPDPLPDAPTSGAGAKSLKIKSNS